MYSWMAVTATAGVLALGAAACGDDQAAAGSSTASKAEPVAQIDALSGQKTEVMLDAGFVDALGTLKLTPAPVGDGSISRGFPHHRGRRDVLRAEIGVAVRAGRDRP